MSIAEKLKTVAENVIKVYKAGQDADPNTYLLVTSSGQEIPAVFVENETVFTATENDIRVGTVAATDNGVTIGSKVIPSYNTAEGYKLIRPNQEFTILLEAQDIYDYTKLQCIICPINKTVANSVAAERVVIDNNVYDVNSTISVSLVTKDTETKSIRLGITNESEKIYLIRYFTYKEMD